MSFRSDFEACVAALRALPRIAVTNAWLGEPATDAEIARAEAEVGPLPAPVRAFYKQHNGAQLRWIDRESPCFSSHDDHPTIPTYDDHVGRDDGADGVIHFVPLASLGYTDLLHDGDVDRYCVFDDCGDEAVALRRSAPGRPLTQKLAVGYDHNVGWDDCTLEFDDYLALTLALYGHVRQRVLRLRGKGDSAWRFPASALRNAVPRVDEALGRRVQWTDERYLYARLRGTVIDQAPETLRIRGDLGGVIERLHRETDPVLTLDDTYELVRSAPEEFLHALLRMPPVAARAMFASLYGDSFGRTGGFRQLPMPLSPGALSAVAALAAESSLRDPSPAESSLRDPSPAESSLRELFVRDVLLTLVRSWIATDATTHELIDGVFYVAEVLTVLATQLPAAEIAPIAALAPAVEAFVARFPSQPWPHPLREHVDYWRSL